MPPDSASSPLVRGFCLAAAAAVTFQLFYLGAQPMAAGFLQPPWDAVAHFLVYSLLTVLLWTGTAGRMPLLVLATVIAVGGFDELCQAGLPGRVADGADFLIDVSAGTCSCALMLLLEARRAAGAGARPRPDGDRSRR